MTVLATVALGVAALGVAPGASAATTYGSECEGNLGAVGEYTFLESHGPVKGVPVSGVITAWKMSADPSFAESTQRLKVARQVPGSEPVIVAETRPELIGLVNKGVATRLPVRAGDLIGTSSQGAMGLAVFCNSAAPADVLYTAPGDPAVGETAAIGAFGMSARAMPVQVTIEPDADGDGFGDETQDACPTNPLLQTACPTLAPPPVATPPTPHLLAVAVVHKGSATVKVSTDIAATVAVSSRVGLGGGAKVTPSAAGKAIAAGGTASFTLKFPKALTAKLAALPAKRKLTLHATVTATSAAGPVGTAALTLKLPGRG